MYARLFVHREMDFISMGIVSSPMRLWAILFASSSSTSGGGPFMS